MRRPASRWLLLLALALLGATMALRAPAADLPLKRVPRPKDGSVTESTSVRFDAAHSASAQAKRDRAAKQPRLVQRLESRLIDAWEQAATDGSQKSMASLRASGVRGLGENVIVIVQCDQTTTPKEVASAIAVNFSDEAMTIGTDGHGCACAEIIYDLAPACQLYLLKTLDLSDDEAAKNYCKAQGIKIISFSSGYYNVNFYDGSVASSIAPHPVTIVNDATANGILWIKSAGNDQRSHAMAGWRDANANGYLDWGSGTGSTSMNELWNGGNPIPVGTGLDVCLTWNKWPVTDQDFALDLYRLDGSTWTYVTSADDPQTGTQCSPTLCLATLSSTPTRIAANTAGASTGPSSFHLRRRAWSPSPPAPS